MAKLIFSLEELAEIILTNQILPAAVSQIKAQGDKLSFVVKVESFFLPAIPASLRYITYKDGEAQLELTLVNSSFNKALSGLSGMLASKLPPCIKLDIPNILVDIDKLLERKNIRGVRVKDITFSDGLFTIETVNV